MSNMFRVNNKHTTTMLLLFLLWTYFVTFLTLNRWMLAGFRSEDGLNLRDMEYFCRISMFLVKHVNLTFLKMTGSIFSYLYNTEFNDCVKEHILFYCTSKLSHSIFLRTQSPLTFMLHISPPWNLEINIHVA